MTLSNLLMPNQSNFQNLAIFICHLFIDGQFRIGHILHDPNILQVDQLTTEIQSICPHSIPWLFTDVTEPFELPWKQNERTDHILQLIFFDPNNLPKNIDDFKGIFTFYRLFVMPSKFSDENELILSEQKKSVFFNSLTLRHDTSANGSVRIDWIRKTGSIDQIYVQFQNEHNNLFDEVFEKYEKNWLLTINYMLVPTCPKDSKIHNVRNIRNVLPYLVNYYYRNLDAKFINIFKPICSNVLKQSVEMKIRKYYKELTTDYKIIGNEQMEKLKINQRNIIEMNLIPTASSKNGLTDTTLYPYNSYKIMMVFFYGIGKNRQIERTSLSDLQRAANIVCWIYAILAVAILCYIRRRNNLRRGGLISSCIDVLIGFVAGGNLNMRHRLERWFFGIFLIGNFFLLIFWMESVFYPQFLFQEIKIKTFDQLARINPPIYILYYLKKEKEIIMEMLRQKIGPNHSSKIDNSFLKLIKNHVDPFACVIRANTVEMLEYFVENTRKYDVLQEHLGYMNVPRYLSSQEYIPKRLIKNINQKTSSLIETGIYQFYISLASFLHNYDVLEDNQLNDGSDDFQAMTVQQFTLSLVVSASLLGLAGSVLVIEIIVRKYKTMKRNQRDLNQSN